MTLIGDNKRSMLQSAARPAATAPSAAVGRRAVSASAAAVPAASALPP